MFHRNDTRSTISVAAAANGQERSSWDKHGIITLVKELNSLTLNNGWFQTEPTLGKISPLRLFTTKKIVVTVLLAVVRALKERCLAPGHRMMRSLGFQGLSACVVQDWFMRTERRH